MKCLIFLILIGIAKSENIFPWPETCYETCQDNEIQIVNMIEYNKDCEEELNAFAPKFIYEDVACQWKNQVVLKYTVQAFLFRFDFFKNYRRLQHKICNVCQPMDFTSEPKISTLCYHYPDQCSSEEDLKYGYCHGLPENSTFCAFF